MTRKYYDGQPDEKPTRTYANASDAPRISDSSPAAGSVFDLECCPYCKGTTGFRYRMYLVGTQYQGWLGQGDQNLDFVGDLNLTKHGAYRCEDCGRIIRPNVTGEPEKTRK